MASEVAVDTGGLNAFEFDSQAVGQTTAALAMGAATGPAVRAGVIPSLGNPLGYIAAGGLTGTLKAGRYLVPSTNPGMGAYHLLLPTDVVLTHDAAAASQPRTDLIIAEVCDIGTSGSFKRFRILKGVAGSGAPDATTNWTTPGGAGVDLGNGGWSIVDAVRIEASASALGAITDRRKYTAGAGGMVPVANIAAATGLPVGTPYYDLALDRPGVVRSGGATPSLESTAWGETSRTPMPGAVAGLNNSAYAALTVATATFTLATGGLVFVRAQIDTQLNAAGYFLARIVGHNASEDIAYDIGPTSRQNLRPAAQFYAPAGTLNLFLEVAVFTGNVTVNSVKWMVAAQGGVS